jgi:hypothetical protein
MHDRYEQRVDGAYENRDSQELVQDVSTKDVGVVRDSVGAIGATTGNIVGSTLAMSSSRRDTSQRDEQLRLRLDLNLDLEIQLKAKIHGDLTLQLLYGFPAHLVRSVCCQGMSSTADWLVSFFLGNE